MTHFDTIVIGTGGVGSAALYQLARRGQNVLGLDTHPAGHQHGSSHGETRVIRQAYFEHPDYVPLLLRAYELWRELECEVDERLLFQVGLLQVGPPDGEVIQGVLKAAKQHDLPVESLTVPQIAERFPPFQLEEGLAGVFEAAAGYLLVENCVKAHVAAAITHGAVWKQSQVSAWKSVDGRLQVETDGQSFTADRLVITAGPWTSQLLPTLSAKLEVRRTHQHWFANSASFDSKSPDAFPVYLIETVDGIFYGFPSVDGDTVKVAEHGIGTAVESSPERASMDVDLTDQNRVMEFLSRHVPAITGKPIRHQPCFYTMTADGHFRVGKHPSCENVFLAAGLSGHGFKFTPVLGEALAELATEGKTSLPVEFLSP